MRSPAELQKDITALRAHIEGLKKHHPLTDHSAQIMCAVLDTMAVTINEMAANLQQHQILLSAISDGYIKLK